jgi:hypothetical protein
MKWLHRLLHPHCDQCREEESERLERERESRVCNSCEVLRNQVAILYEERDKLLDRLLSPQIQKEEPKFDTSNTKMRIPSNFMPWRVKRQMLEAEDKKAAALLKEKQTELKTDKIAQLEKEMGIEDAIPKSNAQV